MKVFDCHSDTMADIRTKRHACETDVLKNHHIPLYKQGGVGGMLYAIWTDPDIGDHQKTMFEIIGSSFEEFDNARDVMELAYNAADVERIMKTDKIAVVLGLEGFDGFNGDLSYLHMLYHLGFRHAMLTWNNDNAFAAGVGHEGPGDGVTPLGKRALLEMEKLGILVDVSHASEKTFWDILENTERPLIASHSNAHRLCPAKRNLKDDQIRAIAERGGVIGMNSWGAFVDEQHPTVERLAEHADYIAKLVGIDHVCCGFDFCGYLDDGDDKENETPGIRTSADCQNFLNALAKLGYGPEALEKVAYGNILRIFKAVLK